MLGARGGQAKNAPGGLLLGGLPDFVRCTACKGAQVFDFSGPSQPKGSWSAPPIGLWRCNSWAIVSMTRSFGSTRAYLPFCSPLNFFSLKRSEVLSRFPTTSTSHFQLAGPLGVGFFRQSTTPISL